MNVEYQENEIVFSIGSDLHVGLLIDGGNKGGVVLYPDWEGCRTAYALRKGVELAKKLQCKVLVTDVYGMNRQPRQFSGDADVFMQKTLSDAIKLRSMLANAAQAYASVLDVPMKDLHVIGTCFGGALAFEYGRCGVPVASVTCIHGDPATSAPSDAFLPTKFLLLHGAADPLISTDRLNAFFTEMTRHGNDWHMVYLGNTRHSFTKEEVGEGNQSLRFDQRSNDRAFDYVANFMNETRV